MMIPANTNASDADRQNATTVPEWREKVLDGILRGMFVFTTPIVILGIINIIQDYRQGYALAQAITLAIIYIAAYILVVFITFARWPSFDFRAAVLILILYGVGTADLRLGGLSSDGLLFHIAFIVMTAILFDRQRSVAALIVSLLTLTVMAWLLVTARIEIPFPLQVNSANLASWVVRIGVFALLGVAIVVSVTYLMRSLERSLVAMHQEHTFVSTILDTADALVVVLDSQGRIIHFNRACRQTTGYALDEVREKYVWDVFLAPEEAEPTRAAFAQLQVNQFPNRHERHWLTKDGQRRLIAATNNVLLDEEGAIEFIIGTGIDITERRQAEETLRESEKVERQQATDLAALLEVVSTANAALEFTQLQDALLRQVAQACDAYRATLYLIDDATGRLLPAMTEVAQGEHGLGDWDTFQGDAARTGLETIPAVQALLAGETPVILDGPEALAVLPRALVEPYGTTSVLAAPIISRGRPLGILTLDHIDPDRHFSPRQADLSLAIANQLGIAIRNARLHEQVQRHAAELEDRVAERTQELVIANARLLELDQLKSKFVSDVSHELRTPVANLSLYLDLLKLGKPERFTHYIDVLQQQTWRLTQLVSDVLDISRLGKSKEEMAFTAVDLNALIAQVVNGERLRAEAAGLRLLFTPCPGLTAVWGNHHRLVQVVSNLVVNAINYTSAGQVEVRVRPVAGQNQVLLTVSDTGRGVAPEDMPHLFDRFYRGQSVGQVDVPGTGLGLAIVREIVALHGGLIEVESEVGRGSVFRVWLPGVEDEQP